MSTLSGKHGTSDTSAQSSLEPESEHEPMPEISPHSPQSWKASKKLRVLIPVCIFYFLFTFLTTVTVPTFADLQERYDATYAQINYTVAIPALALAVSPLFWTPFANIYGRRIVFIFGCGLAFAATVGSALAPTYAIYVVTRFLQGWGVGPASTVGLQMLQDVYSELERGEKVGYWTASIDLGLLFGPLLGGFAAIPGYVWPVWLTAILFGSLLVVMILFLPETAFSGSHSNFRAPFLNLRPIPGLPPTKLWSTTLNCVRLFTYPTVCIPIMFYCWTWYWFIMCAITMVPAAFPDWAPQTQGLLFLGLIIGTAIAEAFFSGRLSDHLVNRVSQGNLRRPEQRLWLYWPASLTTIVGLVLFGCTIQFNWHWVVSEVALAILAFGVQIGNTTTVSYCVDCYPHLAMDVTAFYSFHLNLSAFASPFFIVPWVDHNGWSLSFGYQALIVGVSSLLVVPFLQIYPKNRPT